MKKQLIEGDICFRKVIENGYSGFIMDHNEESFSFGSGRDIPEKQLENLLSKTVMLAKIGGWEIDLAKGSLYWSKITKEIHEVPPDYDPDIDTAVNFYKEEKDRKDVLQLLTSAYNDGISFDFEAQIITAKNKLKWVRVIGEPKFTGGKCISVYGSFQDVDDRVKAELSAKNALEERNVILESIGDAFFAVDNNWVVLYWNNMAEKVLQQPRAKMLNNNLWDVFADAVGSASYKKYHEAVNTGKSIHFDDYYPPLNKWYEISAYPSANGLSVYFKDITKRRLTEGLLKESERRYSELFQLGPVPKWVFDTMSFQLLDVNEAAIEQYGYSREEFLTMTIKDLSPLQEVSRMEKSLLKYKKGERFVFHGFLTLKKKNGRLIKVEVHSNQLQYQGKNAKIILANDITERLNYLLAIEEQNKKLKEISWIQSHIIRAPLSRIMGLIALVEDVNLCDAEQLQILEYIKLSATELDEAIRDITTKTQIVKCKSITA